MNKLNDLYKNGYQIIREFMTQSRAARMGEVFREYCTTNNVGPDSLVEQSHSEYNYIHFVQLLVERINQVNVILNEPVLPTFAYGRVYKSGATLLDHTDRPACEVSITAHLDGDSDWPIYMGRENEPVVLKPGDAVIYFGLKTRHWRPEFTGTYYTQCMLHYVRSRGQYRDHFFDSHKAQMLFQKYRESNKF